ncbi:MAG: thioredoxin [Steroidobacteraceae bacterium]
MSQSNVLHTSDASFQNDVLQSDKPVLVDFWAEWCGPCRSIAPLLEEVAAERHDSLRVVKVNVDDSPALATQFGVRSIPTLILFQNGKPQAQRVGALRRVELDAFLSA